jgi:hypothetical protein
MSLKKITCRIYLIGLFIFFWLIIRSALPLLTFSLGRWDLLSPKTSEGKQEKKNICTVCFLSICVRMCALLFIAYRVLRGRELE